MDEDPIDTSIGSMLEAWLTRDTGPRCRFDNVPLADRGLLQNPALRKRYRRETAAKDDRAAGQGQKSLEAFR